ncbi:MAG: carbamoyltransferase HypF [Sedimentisphaerales bacterium]|nr:carbamoyltransferase HypF [Sedimentisphaerales bacterium]
MSVIRKRILIEGSIQGVGCRPFLYTAATKLGLTGSVWNDTGGVTMEVQGLSDKVAQFQSILDTPDKLPSLMQIAACRMEEIPLVPHEKGFIINQSACNPSHEITQVTVDTAVCRDCLREMLDSNDPRYRYPFINCTNCGPRYSIIQKVPYDRSNTTMASFEMCNMCRTQYTNTGDRRFHAQPVACPNCGPQITLADNKGNITEEESDRCIQTAAAMLREGKILGIKGIGGFHLAVNALDEGAVVRLRKRKLRDHKPFAMMARTLETIRRYSIVDVVAERLLRSPQSPIVLLPKRPFPTETGQCLIASSVAPGTNCFGFMLCYAPLHHLLFSEEGIDVMVMTSANLSDEPLICDNKQAIERLRDVADAFLMHNRDIFRQVDDSVLHVIDGNQALLRRARGYVPSPILLEKRGSKDIFAAGADLKNTFCLVKGRQLILSEHIGDLADGHVFRHYKRSVPHLEQLYHIGPQCIAHDLHPTYLSTQFARSLPAEQYIAIQHHWAHVASVLSEHRYQKQVIGLVADGTGYGTDGAIWGCECLIASMREFRRFGRLRYYPHAGGDHAAKEAIRPLMGLLRTIIDGPSYLEKYDELIRSVEPDEERRRIVAEQIEKNVNTVPTSSLGRLFDAIAAILGLGIYNHFEAQLPMALEASIIENVSDTYPVGVEMDFGETWILDFRGILEGVLEDRRHKMDLGRIAARFHNSIAEGFLQMAIQARELNSLNTVALSGGVFCNRYLANRLIDLLKSEKFIVLWPRHVPVNDGGIALGQAAIAMHQADYTTR